jgi:hypothetical protein
MTSFRLQYMCVSCQRRKFVNLVMLQNTTISNDFLLPMKTYKGDDLQSHEVKWMSQRKALITKQFTFSVTT